MTLLLAACQQPATTTTKPLAPDAAAHAPPFARLPYEPFSRTDAVAIAVREWRAWGRLVDDDPPNTRPPPAPEDQPERVAGFWQRVGEYWWLGVNAGIEQDSWTGKHDADGHEFPAARDENYAWSAAFISYVMRSAGAGPRFPYAIAHATYINIAREMSLEAGDDWALTAEAPEAASAMPGDLICYGRHNARSMRFDELPAGPFTSHCDIVVAVVPGSLTVVGGNVDDAVTMKHVPTTADGKLAVADGTAVDDRYPWFVLLRVLYER